MIIFGDRLINELLRRIDALQADNRALVEALMRQEGKPLIFKPPEVKPSSGWFDGKPRVRLTPGIKS